MDKVSVPSAHFKCPICGEKSNDKYRPFCSKRCADVDLNRWLSGIYKIETDESPDDLPVNEEE